MSGRRRRVRTSITIPVDVYAESHVLADRLGLSLSRLVEVGLTRVLVQHGITVAAANIYRGRGDDDG